MWSDSDVYFLSKVYMDTSTSIEVISKVVQKPDYCIHAKARKLGLKRQKRYYVDSAYFDVLDTWEKCYILGLYSADGNNTEKYGRISINLQEEDKKLLEDVAKTLQFTGEVKYKPSGNNKLQLKIQPQWYLRFTDKYMSNRLTELGVTPRKSLTLQFCKEVPKEFLSAYILGLWDGDGCISFTKSTNQPKFSFVGSESIVNGMAKILHEQCDVELPIIRKIQNNYSFTIGGTKKVKRIRDWLYKDATIFLQRKYDKIFSIKETCSYIPKFCSICENKHSALGFCNKHYQQYLKGKL